MGNRTHRIVILGGGTGGTLAANRLRRSLTPSEAAITVVDQDDRHVYQPGLLFVPFGLAHLDEIVRPRGRQLHRDIAYVQDPIDHVDIGERPGVPGERAGARLRRPRRGHRSGPGPGGDRGAHRARMERACLHLLRPRGRRRARGGAGMVRGGTSRRQRRGDADQVPRGAPRVLLPGRLVLPAAGHPRQGRPDLRDAARRGLHEAGGERAPGRDARGAGHRARDRVQHRRGRLLGRPAAGSCPTTTGRSRSTWPW